MRVEGQMPQRHRRSRAANNKQNICLPIGMSREHAAADRRSSAARMLGLRGVRTNTS
jgi:hypothetical protein